MFIIIGGNFRWWNFTVGSWRFFIWRNRADDTCAPYMSSWLLFKLRESWNSRSKCSNIFSHQNWVTRLILKLLCWLAHLHLLFNFTWRSWSSLNLKKMHIFLQWLNRSLIINNALLFLYITVSRQQILNWVTWTHLCLKLMWKHL